MTGQQLKNSILQMAVQGKLVPQDPNDEPASVLLERIRAEKEQLIKEGKIKKEKNPSIIFRGADNLPYEKIGKNERVCIADDVPFEIPESWEWARWGTLSESIQYGYNAPAQENGRIKMVRISDIQDNSVMWETVPYCDIKEGEIDAYLLKPNDILFARTGGTVGKSYLVQEVPEEAIYAGYLIRTRYSNQLCPQYLKYFMESELYWSQLREGTIATAQPNCNGKTLGNMLVPIPPSHEQIRIVEKLNAVMTHVIEYDTVDSKSKHLNNIFSERLKKSILQEAVQGKLVPQDPADEPASILLERIRAEKQKLVAEGKIKKDKHESVIFRRDNSHYEKRGSEEVCIDDEIPFEIPENWCWSRLSSLCKSIVDGDHQAPPQTVSGIPFIVISNVSAGKIDFTNTRFVSQVYYDNLPESRIPHRNDILFTVTGSYGIVIPVDVDNLFCFQRHIALLKPLEIATDFLVTWLSTPIVCEQCKNYATGTAQKTVGLNSLKNILIPVPPIKEQGRILERLKSVLHLITL
ncbi:restriction endonuclease subunit S [Coprococcus comes]|uniref:restriction endonuclease subunit S n=1 Tax=Coprococcus comes TaxID=410072 RepID=UPI001D0918FC|nr:restriction endonuclease subunit S [Coprococcus comes]MCB6468808.1 restriction endonuclease subunit S [Coprococcus comes]